MVAVFLNGSFPGRAGNFCALGFSPDERNKVRISVRFAGTIAVQSAELLLRVIFALEEVEFVVEATLFEELLVGAGFVDDPFMDDDDAVGFLDAGEAVGYDD